MKDKLGYYRYKVTLLVTSTVASICRKEHWPLLYLSKSLFFCSRLFLDLTEIVLMLFFAVVRKYFCV